MAEETNPTSSPAPPATTVAEMENSQATTNSKAGDATIEENTPPIVEDKNTVIKTNRSPQSEDSADAKITTPESEDAEMKDIEETSDPKRSASNTAGAPTNGTPASSKKASNGSSKKKSSAVPEHKSKKVNKKKSRPMTNLDAQPGEYYFARMKGHPPWPSIVCDEEMLPQSLIDTRPVTTKLPDGTYKKSEYADGGKRAYERTFPIMFLHTNEFAWMPNTELTPLTKESVTEPSEKGKSKLLLQAYEKAAEQNDLAYFKEMLVDHQRAIQEDQEAQAEREAKKASKAKRKSMDTTAQAAEVDDMDIDEEVGDAKPKSKKRKKDIDSDAGDEKPPKTPKTKLKLSTPKTPATEPASKKKAAKPKAKAVVKANGSDDEAVDTPRVEQTPLTPAAAKEIKEKKVLYYRHKLQRGFLSRDTMPKEDEMKSMSEFLSELETFPDLEGSIIRATKIHKVLKAMIKLPSIPLNEEYEFKKRSHDLLTKWNDILSIDQNAGHSGDKAEDSKPDATSATTNGSSKGLEHQAEKAEAGEAVAPEDESKEALENKIGTTVEGEKEAEKSSESASLKKSEKTTEPQTQTEDSTTDEPNIKSAPAEEYKPSGEAVEASA